jgi:hypothetical protein
MISRFTTCLASCLVVAAAACSSAPGAPVSSGANEDAGANPAPGSGSQPTGPSNDDAGIAVAPSEDAGRAVPPAEDAAASGEGGAAPDAGAPKSDVRVVAYLPNYAGTYATWATTIDFTKMTHLNLAFATADSSNQWDMGDSDSDVAALVTAAHAKGVLVLASLGGGGITSTASISTSRIRATLAATTRRS